MNDELVEKLERVVFRLYRGMRRRPELSDLSPQDPILLTRISANPGIGVAELAQLERLRAPTITSHAKRLEAAGMIRRVPHPIDGRRLGLHITAKGKRTLARAVSIRRKELAERLARLSGQERRSLEQAADALIKISEHAAGN